MKMNKYAYCALIILVTFLLGSCNLVKKTPQKEIVNTYTNSPHVSSNMEFAIDGKTVSVFEFANSVPEDLLLNADKRNLLLYMDSHLSDEELISLSKIKQNAISSAESMKPVHENPGLHLYDGNNKEISAIDFLLYHFSQPKNGALSVLNNDQILQITNQLSELDKKQLTTTQLAFLTLESE